MKKQLKGKITISRPFGGDRGDYVSIRVEDSSSRIEFMEFQLDLEDFTKALMGQACIPGDLLVRGLENVGKRYEGKELIFKVPEEVGYAGKGWAEKNCQKFVEEGWTADGYFSSQNSLRRHDDGFYYAYGKQYRFVEDV